MVVGAFPVAKLGILAFKQLSKPIANVIKTKAKDNPFFRQYFCMPPAQIYNWVEVKTKMWALNLGRPAQVPQLNETMAIELGANLLGEIIIFTIGAALLLVEYNRQSKKEEKREQAIKDEKQELQNTLQNLALQLERQDAQIREMNRIIAAIDSKRWLPSRFARSDSSSPPPSPPSSASTVHQSKPNAVVNEPHPPTTKHSFVSGNFDPKLGSVLKALNFIENEIFYRDSTAEPRSEIIQDALVYLNYRIF